MQRTVLEHQKHVVSSPTVATSWRKIRQARLLSSGGGSRLLLDRPAPAPLLKVQAPPAVCPLPQPPVKRLLAATPGFARFKAAIYQEVTLRDDWLDLTSRPWVAGSVDALLDNPNMTQMMAWHSDVAAEIGSIIRAVNTVMARGDRIQHLVRLVRFVSRHPAIYDVVEVVERTLTNDKIAGLQRAADDLFAARRHEVLQAVRALANPVALELLVAAAFALATEERLNTMLNWAEAVIEEHDLLAIAGRRLAA